MEENSRDNGIVALTWGYHPGQVSSEYLVFCTPASTMQLCTPNFVDDYYNLSWFRVDHTGGYQRVLSGSASPQYLISLQGENHNLAHAMIPRCTCFVGKHSSCTRLWRFMSGYEVSFQQYSAPSYQRVQFLYAQSSSPWSYLHPHHKCGT